MESLETTAVTLEAFSFGSPQCGTLCVWLGTGDRCDPIENSSPAIPPGESIATPLSFVAEIARYVETEHLRLRAAGPRGSRGGDIC